LDADKRVTEPLAVAGKTVFILPRANRTIVRDYDRELYEECHLIENFFAEIKQFRAIATRCDKTLRNFGAVVCHILIHQIAVRPLGTTP
jgi:transposase